MRVKRLDVHSIYGWAPAAPADDMVAGRTETHWSAGVHGGCCGRWCGDRCVDANHVDVIAAGAGDHSLLSFSLTSNRLLLQLSEVTCSAEPEGHLAAVVTCDCWLS